MQNAHTRKTAYTFILYFTTDLQRKPNRRFLKTEPAVFLKTKPNLKNPFRTSLDMYCTWQTAMNQTLLCGTLDMNFAGKRHSYYKKYNPHKQDSVEYRQNIHYTAALLPAAPNQCTLYILYSIKCM